MIIHMNTRFIVSLHLMITDSRTNEEIHEAVLEAIKNVFAVAAPSGDISIQDDLTIEVTDICREQEEIKPENLSDYPNTGKGAYDFLLENYGHFRSAMDLKSVDGAYHAALSILDEIAGLTDEEFASIKPELFKNIYNGIN